MRSFAAPLRLKNPARADSHPLTNPSPERRGILFGRSYAFRFFILVGVLSARAKDDNENSTPTAWWFYTGQSVADIGNTLTAKNARIVDIAPDNSAGSSFTAAYVQNIGSYAKQWWWYVGIDATTLAKNLSANHARLVSLKAYDVGGGNIRFAVVMIANAGADAKGWWYYYGQSSCKSAPWPSRITPGSPPSRPTLRTARLSIHAS